MTIVNGSDVGVFAHGGQNLPHGPLDDPGTVRAAVDMDRVHLFDASGLTIGARPNWRDAYLT